MLFLAVAVPSHSVVIRCNFGDLVWSKVGSKYTCSVRSVQNPEIQEVTEIVGNHLKGRSDLNVEAFTSSGKNNFPNFPRNLEKFFPNLLVIQIWSGKLTSITAADLSPWPNLAFLSLSFNKIETLEGDLFRNNQKLTYISFLGNSIINVGLDLLSNLNELKEVYFSSTRCLNANAATPEAIENLKNQLFEDCVSDEDKKSITTPSSTTDLVVTASSSTYGPNQCKGVDDLKNLTWEQARIIDEQIALTNERSKQIFVFESNIQELKTACSCTL